MRKTYVYDKKQGKVVERHERTDKEHFHYVITDDVPEGMQHPCNGLWYTSKSNFRKTTRAHGCVEIGNETQTPRAPSVDRESVRNDIIKTMYQTGLKK